MHVAITEVPISYADTDMMGVVYHGSYIRWLELGRDQLVKDAGFSYLEMEKQGYHAPVYHLEITYKKPLRLGDRAFVKTWVEENHGVRTVYGFQIVNGEGEVCAEGSTTHIVVRREKDGTFRPVSFKKAFPEWFQKYEEIKRK
ncbi:MAG TPA: thioesterase family protein [Symbiobacteriaceae bacterium]